MQVALLRQCHLQWKFLEEEKESFIDKVIVESDEDRDEEVTLEEDSWWVSLFDV